MEEDAFDAIVVGAGPAGAAAAYVLAREGANVLVVERGNYAGAKNMTGGRLYAHSLEKIIPGFADEAPVERRVTAEKVSFLTGDSGMTIDYRTGVRPLTVEESYTVLRGPFDQWLAGKAEEAGAQIIYGVRVDRVVRDENGRVCGIEADGDVIDAKCVIIAEGVNSLLTEQLGMASRPCDPTAVAVGAKELIRLGEDEVAKRFGLTGDEGAAWLFAGSPSNGLMGGGFIYTNKDTVSVGVVAGLAHVGESSKSVPQMLEDFKNHPVVKPLIEGGELVEYSGHVVPEAGINMCPKLYGDGVLVVGDAAGFCINQGFTVRGLDLAICSGEKAAEAVLDAMSAKDFSADRLRSYQTRLKDTFVMHDLELYKDLPAFFENKRIFNDYPKMVTGIMRDMFVLGSKPSAPLRKKLLARVKEVGVMNILKDVYHGGKAI